MSAPCLTSDDDGSDYGEVVVERLRMEVDRLTAALHEATVRATIAEAALRHRATTGRARFAHTEGA